MPSQSRNTWLRLALAFVAMACFGEMVGLGQAGQEPGDVWAVVAERPAGLPARATFVGSVRCV